MKQALRKRRYRSEGTLLCLVRATGWQGGGGGVHTAKGPGFQETETHVHMKTCTQMLTAALFIITSGWKQPKCPSADGRIHKMWSRPRNIIQPQQRSEMQTMLQQGTLLGEGSQTRKTTEMPRIANPWRQKADRCFQGPRGRNGE